jgi:rSAM/selenodomain-associated transferase 1
MAKPLVVIFARAPRYGAVKTRLARDIGAGEALRFYKRTLDRVVRLVRADARFDIALAHTPDHERDGLPLGIRLIGQGPGDLGQRMVRALRSAGNRPAVVIGSDIPDVSAAHIRDAFALLGRKPFALGPVRDGGYWLIGAKHPLRMPLNILAGVRWSSASAMQDTIERLQDVARVDDMLDDVDDGAAYRRHKPR